MAFVPASAATQDAPAEWVDRLHSVVPGADAFTDKRGQPPVFEAYETDPQTGQQALVGYAFLTSDLPPEQKGFTGPIEVLVGMDLRGVLSGILVTEYTESHRATRGDFLATPGFQEQFTGKSILDAFRVRRDVDGMTGATISVDAMSRGIRNAAREIAVAYGVGVVATASAETALDPTSVTVADLEGLSWTQMILRGFGQEMSVLDDERTTAALTLAYLRDEAVAEVLLGRTRLDEVLDRAGPLAQERHLVLVGVDGPSAGALNLLRLSIVQGSDTVGLTPPDVLLFGPPRDGKLDGEFRMMRILLFDRVVDMTKPFAFVLDLRPALGVFSADYPGEQPAVEEDQFASPWAGPGAIARLAILFALALLISAGLVRRLR